jgi:putative methylase
MKYEPEVGSKKELAILLSKLKVFEKPKVKLEQYPTDSEVAADLLWRMIMSEELQGKTVVDLGCGTGILGIGALECGAKHVTFIDIDADALELLQQNLKSLSDIKPSRYTILEKDVKKEKIETSIAADIVLQNPPFGTRDEHADIAFLNCAIRIAPTIYSMHKTNTLQYIDSWVQKNDAEITQKTNYDFPIKQTFAHQTRKIVRIEVSCVKIEKR